MGNVYCFIPARMGSSRFPGKPLAKIHNIPLLEHVWRRTSYSTLLKKVFIATCDEEIASYMKKIGAEVVMTSAKHTRATDRVAEAVQSLSEIKENDIALMVQGDEPLITPDHIEASLTPFRKSPNINVVNLMSKISPQEAESPDEIKVVFDHHQKALYFSREKIPHNAGEYWKQVCVIPMKVKALLEYTKTAEAYNEIKESVDMLRFLEMGIPVYFSPTFGGLKAVDRPRDIEIVQELLNEDKIFLKYKNQAGV